MPCSPAHPFALNVGVDVFTFFFSHPVIAALANAKQRIDYSDFFDPIVNAILIILYAIDGLAFFSCPVKVSVNLDLSFHAPIITEIETESSKKC